MYPVGTTFTWFKCNLKGQKGRIIGYDIEFSGYTVEVIEGSNKSAKGTSFSENWTDIQFPLNRNGANKL